MTTGSPGTIFGSGGGILAQTSALEGPVEILRVSIVVLALLLLALSLSAYRRTSLRSLLIAAAAFGLFVVQIAFDYLGDAVGGPFGPPYDDIISTVITLAILALFFLAIVKGKAPTAPAAPPKEPASPP